jgi:hypothetical protein
VSPNRCLTTFVQYRILALPWSQINGKVETYQYCLKREVNQFPFCSTVSKQLLESLLGAVKGLSKRINIAQILTMPA